MKFQLTTAQAANGTSLQGYITTTYQRLIEIFGTPEYGGDKTTVTWCIEFADGTVATIYDWKETTTPIDLHQWHVGGHTRKALWHVIDLVDN